MRDVERERVEEDDDWDELPCRLSFKLPAGATRSYLFRVRKHDGAKCQSRE